MTALAQRKHIDEVDTRRKALSKATAREKKAQLGQFMTPAEIAGFMASLFSPANGHIRLLDPGAGIGSLTSAVAERQLAGHFGATSIHAVAFELDSALSEHLNETLSRYAHDVAGFAFETHARDFLQAALFAVKQGTLEPFSHAILNPPYKKIGTGSVERAILRRAGIETVNLYSGFVALALMLLRPGGQLCAIIPRSFCNGPYYRPFREFMLSNAAVRRVHLFESRTHAFSDDDVLQENVILLLEKGAPQGDVSMSSSRDQSFSDISVWTLPFSSVVRADDPDKVIHLPSEHEASGVIPDSYSSNLGEVGIGVATGPVVDFRLREHLRAAPEPGSAPLLYASHFVDGHLCWPRDGGKKPNGIVINDATKKWLFPRGNYTVVRRFSSKEERRRIVATVVREDDLQAELLGFENHLNVFHHGKRGLDLRLAAGLATYLNSTVVDVHFRTFNGHTQVNATDLRMLPYPDHEELLRLGEWAEQQNHLTQEAIDARVGGTP